MLKSIIIKFIDEYIESQQHIKNLFILNEDVSIITLDFKNTELYSNGLYSINLSINNHNVETKYLDSVDLECTININFIKYLDISCFIVIKDNNLDNDSYYFDGKVLHYSIAEHNFTDILLFKKYDVKLLILYMEPTECGKLQYEIDFDFSTNAERKLIDLIDILNYISTSVMIHSFKIDIKFTFKRIRDVKGFNQWKNIFMSEHKEFFEIFDRLQCINSLNNYNFNFYFNIVYYSDIETELYLDLNKFKVNGYETRENIETIVNLLLPKLKSFIYFSKNRVDMKVRTYNKCYYFDTEIKVNDINSFSYL